MDYLNSLTNKVTGAANSVTGAESTASPSAPSFWSSLTGSSTPVPKEEEKLDGAVDGVANGENGVANGENGAQAGGKRKSKRRQCGGSFHPYTPSSNLASTASSFKGGRRRKSRKSYKKKSRRKSYRKRR
jgi:hypothetical protein